jgi:deoxyribose-phosphate aldolase
MSDAAAIVARRAIGLVDLTDLSDSCAPEAIDELCRRAVGPYGSTAAVCVWPAFVAQAADRLRGSGVSVATVVNFPSGDETVDATVAQTTKAIIDGADEIDLVLPYHAFLAGREREATTMVESVRRTATAPVLLKVILESGSYPLLDSIRDAARLAVDHGANFVKTSTGKTSISATLAATVMILDAIRQSGLAAGFKASGGIRTVEDAAHYLAVADEMMGKEWATKSTFRFGASGLADALEASIRLLGDGR